MAVSIVATGRIYNRAGPRFLIGLGLFMNAVSFYQLSLLSLDAGYWDIFVPQVLQGIGAGFIFVSLTTAVFSTVEKPLMTAASGLYNMVRQVFGSVGIALAATFLTRGETLHHALLAEHVTVFRDVASESLQRALSLLSLQGANGSGSEMEALKVLDDAVTRQASILAYNHVYMLIAWVYLFSIALVALIKPSGHTMPTRMVAE